MRIRCRGGSSFDAVKSGSSRRLLYASVSLLAGAAVVLEAALPQGDLPDVRAIVVEAVERMGEELRAAGSYRALMTSESRAFGGSGEVTEETRVEWEAVPLDGATFTRRLQIDGRPLTEDERTREQEREAEFRERLRRLRAGETQPEDDENRVVFDEELVARYHLTPDSEEPLRDRPSYRIAFAPRDGDLPVRRAIDRALNRVRGRIWIDRETREVARLEFELIDRVRLWWGLVGTIHHFRGSLDRGPVLDGIWGNLQDESYSDIRFFFSRSRQASIRQWRAYAWTETPATEEASAGGNLDDVDGGAR